MTRRNAESRLMPRRGSYRARFYQADFFVVRGLAAFVTEQVGQCVAPGARVVDLGCGEQPFREAIERRGATYLGLDVAQNVSTTVQVVSEATDIPLRENAVDVVICTEVLEHMPDPSVVVREISRVLKRGGRAVITSPFLYPLHEEPYDFGRITLHQLRRMASAAGLEVMVLDVAGNELEVIATTWCNLWSRLRTPRGWGRGAVVLWRVLARVPVNVGVALASRWFGGLLPRKAYLNTLCVLRKAEGDGGPLPRTATATS